ncbi:glutamine amidotransferase subunit pdxT [Capsaspora owczarzaki ATCC 30864]|uniref:glutaminase n=1 Tax=Capsaspora owczarzaki (strain ATCC 30864) TaxID=595528 RepID=A0A0D2WR94_CAPO3|nr:glutamine amidotransferase subunit pdxT [Capsaspora owczarzaki ATCC 30864]KJE93673.1 glutamine amidotransferase subunit pdxT [Capsaspora owczarzaki ATCC 30864]|eukprot:XP_004348255.1 glutamine amidotransferase subunit pdxT [Capsaspora owczarzaki ATCC 30864]
MASPAVKIGVLALQGAFIEHIHVLGRIENVTAVQIRTPAEVNDPTLDALIIPGGESTTMGLVAERSGIVEPLRLWAHQGVKPVWGTCAGMILLANSALQMKIGGQPLLGGLDVCVDRNHFGAQLQSFEMPVSIPVLGEEPFQAVFIRAPVIVSHKPNVTVIAKLEKKNADDEHERIIAARQSNLLATAFHPELTGDSRFHRYFVEMVRTSKLARQQTASS